MCDWQMGADESDSTASHKWRRALASEAARSSLILPQRDHTTNTDIGHYMLVDTRNWTTTSASRLFGPVFDAASHSDDNNATLRCQISFYYYIHGEHSAGTLSLLSRSAIGGQTHLLSTIRGTNEQRWLLFSHWLPLSSSAHHRLVQPVLEARPASHPDNDGLIAVDDIRFSRGCVPTAEQLKIDDTHSMTTTADNAPFCGRDMFLCLSDKRCISREKVCDFVADCGDGEDERHCSTCDFEQDACGWYDESHSGNSWQRTAAADTRSLIRADVSTKGPQGSFMLSSSRHDETAAAVAKLFTPTLGRASPRCEFQFYYYCTSSSNETTAEAESVVHLALYGEWSGSRKRHGRRQRLWEVVKDRLWSWSHWRRVRVPIRARDTGFRLFFELRAFGGGAESQVAIDNTSFIDCHRVTDDATCSHQASAFRCNNGMCIPNSLVSNCLAQNIQRR